MNVQAAGQNLRRIVNTTWPVLLDFDGPITYFFIDGRNQRLSKKLRDVLRAAQVALPPEVAKTPDPLAVLRWAALHTSPEVSATVNATCIEGEHRCARESTPTPGAIELLQACKNAGRPVLIVSNNAPGPIKEFLERQAIGHLIDTVIGRTPGRPELMKPHPHMLEAALRALRQAPDRCAFVGDSITDIEVAQITGVRSIGYAKHQRRGQELAAAGADALVDNMSELANAIRADALQRA